MTSPRARQHQAGFTLLEVLVAFAVLTVTLGILLNLFSLAIQTSRTAQDQQKAVLLAESKLAELDAGATLRPGVERGEFDDRFAWETRIEEYDSRALMDNQTLLLPYRLSVVVSWSDHRRYELATLRLVRTEAR
ncbi:prepilin-type N-terminal cleavage/methylation domain-containing protein [Oceanimonas pelagia]|uniref:Prepilin-type N-terminal cleavage/methylation domain-containing protein n=1 Tax=Oceanimonas pelagia TaxID=3028314 RepID=A0AA50KN00_9GAMM|nr:prepilin-type N-terminal cleavage/methylation domain-containing protein [Oceanimonas pelagia]WMC10513.1 prepilin-type N-terminal cleavage/methylation domain-containing protein [Oceanimonas pelagia]